jgi:hypothetical protein
MQAEGVSLYQDETPFSGPDDRYAGIRALWIKVIIRAIFDWVGGRDHPKLAKRKEAELAHTWIFKESLLFNSFDNVCKYVDLNPVVVRDRIRNISKEQVKKIEYLERYQMPEELERLMASPAPRSLVESQQEVALQQW